MQPDLTESPGLEPCDRCSRIRHCEWFGAFWLCQGCTRIAEKAIGLEAAGRAIERLAKLHALAGLWAEEQEKKRHGKKGTGANAA